MNIDEIKLKWRLKDSDKQANINLWDEKAEHFGKYRIPNLEEDDFLKLLKNEDLIRKEFEVLDVGCGGGKYALALAKECRQVYAIDLSTKMIEYANDNKKQFNINNVDFLCDNWHEININESNLYKKFDLVFASMTPAVESASTFEKMIEASKKYCVLRCNTKRNDLVYDKIREHLNMIKKDEDLNFLYAFNFAYLRGYEPKVFYEKKQWSYKEPLEKAYNVYINKIKSIKEINKSEEDKIKQILNNMSNDGYIEEKINSTIATMVWSVK